MKMLLALWVLLCPMFLLAQQKKTPEVATKGHIEGILNTDGTENTIRLARFGSADIPVKVDAKGHFSIDLPIAEPGFYELENVGRIYLSPGYQISLKLNADSTYTFSGRGSQANNIYSGLKKPLSRFLPYQEKTGLTPEAYLMDIPVFSQKMADFEKYSGKIISEVQDPFFREIAMKDLQYFDNKLLYSAIRGQGKTIRDVDSITKKQVVNRVFYTLDPNDVKLFQNSASYRTAVEEKMLYLTYVKAEPGDINNKEAKILFQRKLANEMVREVYILNDLHCKYTIALLKAVSSTTRRDSVYTAYMRGNPTKAHIAEVEQTYRRQLDYGDNGMAPDFIYADVNGNNIKLSDLRGKYVYIDIWATWCGPCKAQIPALAELESNYHGKNIQFLSISIDEVKDRNKWASFVKKEQLGGIQVMADNAMKSDFIQKFNINAIPRFILIDPKGKIISANAKRPSDPGMRKYLDALL